MVERLRGETYLYVRLANEQVLVVKATGESRARIGDDVSIGVPAASDYVFDDGGVAVDRTERHSLADFGRDPFVRRTGPQAAPNLANAH